MEVLSQQELLAVDGGKSWMKTYSMAESASIVFQLFDYLSASISIAKATVATVYYSSN